MARVTQVSKWEKEKERSKQWLFGDRRAEMKGYKCVRKKSSVLLVLLNGINTRTSKMDWDKKKESKSIRFLRMIPFFLICELQLKGKWVNVQSHENLKMWHRLDTVLQITSYRVFSLFLFFYFIFIPLVFLGLQKGKFFPEIYSGWRKVRRNIRDI